MPVFQKFTGFDPVSLGMGVLGGLGSLFGGSGMSAEQKRQLHFQNQIASKIASFANSAPLADRGEQLGLAQAQGLLGEQQAAARNQAMAAYNPAEGNNGLGDFLANLASNQTAQKMSLNQQALMNALAERRNALLQASQVGMQAASLANQPQTPNPLPTMFGQLAQQIAYNQAYKRGLPGAGAQAVPKSAMQTGTAGIAGAGGGDMAKAAYNAGQASGGLVAPGNEMGGSNGLSNQIRQASGMGYPGGLEQGIRQFVAPSGLRLTF